MYIMYIDESGDTASLSQGGKKFLILTGCIIFENDIPEIEEKLRDIKSNSFKIQILKSNQIFSVMQTQT